jgi:hypothetical protein
MPYGTSKLSIKSLPLITGNPLGENQITDLATTFDGGDVADLPADTKRGYTTAQPSIHHVSIQWLHRSGAVP